MTIDLLTPADKRNPKMWNQKYDKNVGIDFLIEFLRFAQYSNALFSHIIHNNCHSDVKYNRVNCCQRFPFKTHSSCRVKVNNKTKTEWECKRNGKIAFCVIYLAMIVWWALQPELGTAPTIICGPDRIDHDVRQCLRRPNWAEHVRHVSYHLEMKIIVIKCALDR